MLATYLEGIARKERTMKKGKLFTWRPKALIVQAKSKVEAKPWLEKRLQIILWHPDGIPLEEIVGEGQ